jgi:hypothetical protein
MTYSSAGLIEATDYNGFVSTLNSVWNSLWGQSAVGTVSAGGTVTATQWATLAGTITNAYIHESGSNPSVSSPSAGQTIGIITNLSTAVSYVQTNAYNSYAFGTQLGLSSSSSAVGSANNAWQLVWTQSINFASGAARSYYFNCGGVVYLTFQKSSTGQTNDPTWNALAAACNQISFTSTSTSKTIVGVVYQGTNKQGGSGVTTVLRTDIGYAQLTGSPVTIFQQYYATYPYTGSYIAVNASLSGNNVLFQTYWYQPASGYAFEAVNISAGGITAIYNTPPETTYISNTWGTPSLSSSVA